MTQEALKLAIQLRDTASGYWTENEIPIIEKLIELLAQTQEPVAHWSDCSVHSEPAYPKGECDCGGFNPTAWLVEDADGSHLYWTYKEPIGNEKWTPLYTTPPQRTWVGLTNNDWNSTPYNAEFRAGAEWADAKLKDKNT